MANDQLLHAPRFPRASRYHPDWVLAGVGGGANPLWLAEWLGEVLELRPGMRVLELGCGRALSSVFLHREYGVQVWAADLWYSAAENIRRIRDAGVEDGVFPIRSDARSLPFTEGFFDAVVAIDSFMYFGTDDLYLNSLARLLKPAGVIGIAQAGLLHEIDSQVPPHLADWWTADMPYCLHTAEWWQRHWERTGIVDVTVADTMPDGWRYWRDWIKLVAPQNTTEIEALDTDAGRNFGYIRAIGRLRPNAILFDPNISSPSEYTRQPLLRGAR
jgi:SAM-dependent methyltransferase